MIVKGSQWSEANAEAERHAQITGGFLIHPFDQPDLWAGHASLVHEVPIPADYLQISCIFGAKQQNQGFPLLGCQSMPWP